MSRKWPQASVLGFMIIELLIVIVIIAILAAITIVAYNGIQARAKDSNASTSVDQLSKAVEMYKIDNGIYPAFCSADNTGCTITTPIATEISLLTPTYISTVPTFPFYVQYVRGSGGVSYGLLVSYSTGSCKYISNLGATGWWGSSTPVCSE